MQKLVFRCKNILHKYGFGYIWNDPSNVNSKEFILLFKQAVIDEFNQEWRLHLNNNNTMSLYKHINDKDAVDFKIYLDQIPNRTHRILLTKLRVSSHQLRIETGRYGRARLERFERVCQLCNQNDIEDEFHFVIKCPVYNDIRIKYIKPYYRRRPSMYKFISLLQSDNKNVLTNLCKFLKDAFVLRTQLLN